MYVDPEGTVSCSYTISGHTLTCISSAGETITIGPDSVKSGANTEELNCQDNPACTDQKNLGPIPQGAYEMVKSEKRPGEYWLQESWTQRQICSKLGYGRCEFFLHVGRGSIGCINIHKDDELAVAEFLKLTMMLDSDTQKGIKNTLVVGD